MAHAEAVAAEDAPPVVAAAPERAPAQTLTTVVEMETEARLRVVKVTSSWLVSRRIKILFGEVVV